MPLHSDVIMYLAAFIPLFVVVSVVSMVAARWEMPTSNCVTMSGSKGMGTCLAVVHTGLLFFFR